MPERAAEKNHQWKGGNRLYWTRKALERDNYTCQQCGYREDEIMQIDHILPVKMYPDLKCDINNLQTLCPNCHFRKTLKDRKMIAEFKQNETFTAT